MKRFASLSSLALVTAVVALSAHGCSSSGGSSSAECSSLDRRERAQASLLAYAEATSLLRDRALQVEAQFMSVCNAINGELGLAPAANATEACRLLRGRVLQAFDAGVTIEAQVGFNCAVDIEAQAECEAGCQVQGQCDLQASCTGGELVVECNGVCTSATSRRRRLLVKARAKAPARQISPLAAWASARGVARRPASRAAATSAAASISRVAVSASARAAVTASPRGVRVKARAKEAAGAKPRARAEPRARGNSRAASARRPAWAAA
jgi:hypothetical protein